jgi:hypothetical protein
MVYHHHRTGIEVMPAVGVAPSEDGSAFMAQPRQLETVTGLLRLLVLLGIVAVGSLLVLHEGAPPPPVPCDTPFGGAHLLAQSLAHRMAQLQTALAAGPTVEVAADALQPGRLARDRLAHTVSMQLALTGDFYEHTTLQSPARALRACRLELTVPSATAPGGSEVLVDPPWATVVPGTCQTRPRTAPLRINGTGEPTGRSLADFPPERTVLVLLDGDGTPPWVGDVYGATPGSVVILIDRPLVPVVEWLAALQVAVVATVAVTPEVVVTHLFRPRPALATLHTGGLPLVYVVADATAAQRPGDQLAALAVLTQTAHQLAATQHPGRAVTAFVVGAAGSFQQLVAIGRVVAVRDIIVVGACGAPNARAAVLLGAHASDTSRTILAPVATVVDGRRAYASGRAPIPGRIVVDVTGFVPHRKSLKEAVRCSGLAGLPGGTPASDAFPLVPALIAHVETLVVLLNAATDALDGLAAVFSPLPGR